MYNYRTFGAQTEKYTKKVQKNYVLFLYILLLHKHSIAFSNSSTKLQYISNTRYVHYTVESICQLEHHEWAMDIGIQLGEGRCGVKCGEGGIDLVYI